MRSSPNELRRSRSTGFGVAAQSTASLQEESADRTVARILDELMALNDGAYSEAVRSFPMRDPSLANDRLVVPAVRQLLSGGDTSNSATLPVPIRRSDNPNLDVTNPISPPTLPSSLPNTRRPAHAHAGATEPTMVVVLDFYSAARAHFVKLPFLGNKRV